MKLTKRVIEALEAHSKRILGVAGKISAAEVVEIHKTGSKP